jgi:hypothetical protein
MESNPFGELIFDNEVDIVIPIQKVAIFASKYNTGNKHDATGAFQPEASNYCNAYKISNKEVELINNLQGRLQVAKEFLNRLETLSSQKSLGTVVIFSHGYTHGIQFGLRSSGHPGFLPQDAINFERFVKILVKHPSPVIVLYACSTGDDPDGDSDSAPGSGDGSFGDLLRDSLCRAGATYNRVFTHTTAGHTTRNTYIKILDGEGSSIGGVGGKLLANPGSKEWTRLHSKVINDDFRFRLPYLSKERITEILKK